jgi:hypothetical protein
LHVSDLLLLLLEWTNDPLQLCFVQIKIQSQTGIGKNRTRKNGGLSTGGVGHNVKGLTKYIFISY